MELIDAIQSLRAAGAVVMLPEPERRALSLREAARALSVSVDWFRDHLDEFPHAYRLPGGGRNGGELRIPARDLQAFERRFRVVPT
jgi:hypothetical protein